MQELEPREIQDEGEEFFKSLDPETWQDKNEDAFVTLFSRFGGENCEVHPRKGYFRNITKIYLHHDEGHLKTVKSTTANDNTVINKQHSPMHACLFRRHPHTPFWPHHRNLFYILFLLFSAQRYIASLS